MIKKLHLRKANPLSISRINYMKKILIVDDSTFMRNVIKDLLTNQKEANTVTDVLEFYEADGKTRALEQVKKIKPDAILLDIVMGENIMDGVEFLEEVKPYFNTKNIIMISSIGQAAVVDKCKSLGVIYYIQKPIVDIQLIEAVNRIIK